MLVCMSMYLSVYAYVYICMCVCACVYLSVTLCLPVVHVLTENMSAETLYGHGAPELRQQDYGCTVCILTLTPQMATTTWTEQTKSS